MKQIIVNNISTWYYITEDGHCFNSKTGNYLKGQVNAANGYLYFQITFPDGTKKRLLAHRLVAQAFIPNPLQKTEVNHIDGNKLNNNADNLEWATPSENQQHALALELRKFKHVYCFNKDKMLIAEYKNIPEAARAVKISYSIIGQELNKEIKNLSGGFYWSYEPILRETKNYPNMGRSKPVNQYDLNGKFINTYSSTGEAARSIGVKSGTHIGECCRGKIKSYKGFVWRYVEDIISPSSENQSKND